MRRYIIIGSGVAGLSAAEAVRHYDPAGHVTVVGDDPHGYYSRPGLAYYLNGTIPEQQLFPRPVQDLRDLFPRRVHARVTTLAPDAHEIILEDGRRLAYDRLLIATGSRSATPDFPGNDLRGIVKLDTLEDVKRILKLVRRGRPAVVIGGGIIAIELAEGLVARGMHVRYFLRGERFWATMLDEVESRIVERGLAHEGVRLHYRTQVARAIGKQGAIVAVETKAGDMIPCQMLGTAIGLRPRIELAQSAGLASDRGVLVNEYLETSAGEIYAAGDVAQIRDPTAGTTWLETLWPTARLQGQVAGANMAGIGTICVRPTSFNAVKIGEIVTATIGALERKSDQSVFAIASNDRDSWREPSPAWFVQHDDAVSRVRVLVGEQSLVAAVVMGDQTLARPLLRMIEDGVDISPIRAALHADPACGVALLARFYREHIKPRAAARSMLVANLPEIASYGP